MTFWPQNAPEILRSLCVGYASSEPIRGKIVFNYLLFPSNQLVGNDFAHAFTLQVDERIKINHHGDQENKNLE